jgi:hydroxymethylbilane synthase
LPAVGQGALGLEIRADDTNTLEALQGLNHVDSHAAVIAERSLLNHLRGGCLAPVAAWCRIENGELRLQARVLALDGSTMVAIDKTGSRDQAAQLGIAGAEDLIGQGAERLIAAARG